MPDHAANYEGEKEGLKLLLEQIPGTYLPSKSDKKLLLELLGIDRSFQLSFDAVRLYVESFGEIKSAKDFDLIEVKTTAKYLPELPHGFFFGLTDNENTLLRVFQTKFFLAFVSTHSKSRKVVLLNWKGVQDLICNKRIQYQINLSPVERTKTKAAKASQ